MAQNILKHSIELLLVGGSAGSLEVIIQVFPLLLSNLPFAIVMVLHRKHDSDSALVELLASKTTLPVQEASEKDFLIPGNVYIAPPDYHLLIEDDRSLSLDYSEKINFSRPCIDVTFETAAEVYGNQAAALLLSGASADGSKGLEKISSCGGLIAVQNPDDADVPYMPQKALELNPNAEIIDSQNIAAFINSLALRHH